MRQPSRYVARDGQVTWRIRFRQAGRDRSITFHRKDEAQEFAGVLDSIGADRALEWLDQLDTDAAGAPSLDEWAERYITGLTGITDGTRLTYRRLYDRAWSKPLGRIPVNMIDRHAIAAQVNGLSRERADKTVANAHGLLSAMLAAAVPEHLPANPCKGIRLPRRTDHQRVDMRFLDHDEFAQLLAAMPEHYQPAVMMLAGTGIRWGELEALTVADVDTAAGTVRINKSAKWDASRADREVGPTKTRRSRRTITMPVETTDAVRPLLAGRAKGERLFLAPRGGPLRHRTFYDDWKKACQKSGLDPQPRLHDLRHSHVAWLVAANVPLPVIQARLGHESITTTIDTYGHLLPDLQVQAAAAASLAFQGRPAIGS